MAAMRLLDAEHGWVNARNGFSMVQHPLPLRGALDPRVHPRMGWHDVAVVVGPPTTLDLAMHVAERWNHDRIVTQSLSTPVLLPWSDTSEWWSADWEEFGPRPGFSRNLADAAADAARNATTAGAGLCLGPREAGDVGRAYLAEQRKKGRSGEEEALGRAEMVARLLLVEARMRAASIKACPRAFIRLFARAAPSVDVIPGSGTMLDQEIAAASAAASDETFHRALSRTKPPPTTTTTTTTSPTSPPTTSPPPPSALMRARQVPWMGERALRLDRGRRWRGQASCLVLRSTSKWALGVPYAPETSVREAMVRAIAGSRHFVYLENQFFLSSTGLHGIQNDVAEALVGRIRRAIRDKATFRAILVLPAFPEGDPTRNVAMQAVLHYQLASICRGPNSLLGRLRSEFPDTDLWRFVSIFALRTCGIVGGRMATEMVYVHSKVLVVDDRVAIVGSANVNDRSLCGRDTEVSIMFSGDVEAREATGGGSGGGSGGGGGEVQEGVEWGGKMDGAKVQVSPAVARLRTLLWRRHLGLDQSHADSMLDASRPSHLRAADDLVGAPSPLKPKHSHSSTHPHTRALQARVNELLRDPIRDATYYGLWMSTALHNTTFYERTFPATAQFTSYEAWRRDFIPPHLCPLLKPAPTPTSPSTPTPTPSPTSSSSSSSSSSTPVIMTESDRLGRDEAVDPEGVAAAETQGLLLPFREWDLAWDNVQLPIAPHHTCFTEPNDDVAGIGGERGGGGEGGGSGGERRVEVSVSEGVEISSAPLDTMEEEVLTSKSSGALALERAKGWASAGFEAFATAVQGIATASSSVEGGATKELIKVGVYYRPPAALKPPIHAPLVSLPHGVADPHQRPGERKPVGFLVWGSLAFMLGADMQAPLLSREGIVGREVFQ